MNSESKFITVSLLGIIVFLSVFLSSCEEPKVMESQCYPATDVQEDWRLGVQSYTFRKFTFFEAVDRTVAMGLRWIEAYPGQLLSKDSGAKMHFKMSDRTRQKVQEKLKTAGVKLICYGVVSCGNEADWRKLFEFAKAMGIETITSEPEPSHLDMVEELCEEFHINLAIHNHPEPSLYWNPDRVLEVVKGRSKRIGACADTGHWQRSGINPVEALKKLQGHIISLHLKDIDTDKGHDVVWGTGKGNVKAILSELDRQNFKGLFSIEYEHSWSKSMPQIRKCIRYFDRVSAELGHARWQQLFNGKDLTSWLAKPGSWVIEEGGILKAVGGGEIWTKDTYGDFILDLEFKLAEGTNSGVFIRTGDIKKWLHTAIEVQILDSYGKAKPDKHDCGSIFDCLEPSRNMVKKPGQWNRYIITCKANKIYVVLNGEQIINMDLNQWTEAYKNPDGTPNKFNTAYKDMPRIGQIGLQYHGNPIWYRNIRIKPLR